MDGVILFFVVMGLVFSLCFFFSCLSKRKDRDLLQYLVLLTLYRKGQATESDILRYLKIEIIELKIEMIEACCSLLAIPKEKDVRWMLAQCLKIKFITQDDSEQPFLYYTLTELGEVWVENKISAFVPSVVRKNSS